MQLYIKVQHDFNLKSVKILNGETQRKVYKRNKTTNYKQLIKKPKD